MSCLFYADQAVTAAVRNQSDKQMKLMLQLQQPWWHALQNPANKSWLELFLLNDDFKRWYQQPR
jgi:hypothetical protein